MARHTKRRRLMSEINVVPYIDVMLVLLIIFMITAPLLTEGVKVNLPQARAKPVEPSDSEPLIVVVDAEGQFYIQYGEDQDKPVDGTTLVARVSAVIRHRPNVQILVRGDDSVPYGDVVYVMSLLQSAGAPSVGLLTKRPEDGGG